MADHTVPAHRGKHQYLRVGKFFGFPLKAQGVSHTMTGNACVTTALLSCLNGSRDVDAETEVFCLDAREESFCRGPVVKNRSTRGGMGEPIQHCLIVR